jgi:Uma2 family endonuclease
MSVPPSESATLDSATTLSQSEAATAEQTVAQGQHQSRLKEFVIDPELVEQMQADGVMVPPCNLWSDEPPLESTLHLHQIILLLNSLNWLWSDRQDYFAAGNLTIYYNAKRLKSKDFRGPDFFVVLGTDNTPRRSWTIWEEGGKYPNVIVELLSDSTAKTDRTTKKAIYQNTFRTPDYFWFDPYSMEFQGFHLHSGVYQELQPNEQGWLWSQQLELYLGIQDEKLRFFTPDGVLVPTPEEAAVTEKQRAEAERQRNAKLAEKLRELGINPDEIE